MNMVLKLGLRNLTRNKRRSWAIILTVALGTGSLYLYHGFNNGIMNQYKYNTIHSRYGHGQIFTKGYRDQVFEKPWDHWIENFPVLSAELEKHPSVEYLFPRVEFFGLLTNGEITVSGRGQGILGEKEAKFFNALNMVEGVNLSDQPDGIILGKGLARALDAKIGSRVTVLLNTVHGSLNGLDFHVVGTFHTGVKEFDDLIFRVPLSMAQTLLDTTKVESVSIGLRADDQWEGLEKFVASRFPELDSVPFAILDKFYYQNAVDFLQVQFNFIQLIILIIVILGIFNTVSTSILERRQEVGNLKANGESNWDVMVLLLTEGAVIGGLGALLGVVLSHFLVATVLAKGVVMPPGPGITRQFHVLIELDFGKALVTSLMGVVAALFGTILAGLKVVRTPIGELLRSI